MKPSRENIVNDKSITYRDVDRARMPENMEITDIGLSDPKNPTKVTISNNNFSNALWEFIPSVLTMLAVIFIFIFIMGRM